MKKTLIACLLLPLAFAGSSSADDDTAKDALAKVAKRHGDAFTRNIVKIKATDGVPTPKTWWVTAHDPTSPTLLREFRVGGLIAADEGVNSDFYPRLRPTGFIKRDSVLLDSIDAFRILDREAQAAKVGFDSIDYLLRCREFSSEPIWTLSAVDKMGRIAGVVDISAESGDVLRTTWFPENQNTKRRDIIIDSALISPPKRTGRESTPTPPLPLNPLRENPAEPAPINPTEPVTPVVPAEPRLVPTPIPQTSTANLERGPAIDSEVPEVIPVE